MEISDKKLSEITRRVMLSRMRLLVNNGFYGLLLMHMKISISDEFETAWTDYKERIWFNPNFIEKISDLELDYALMHQIMHVALQHGSRLGTYNKEAFDKASDVVVNSNIYHSNNDNEDFISLACYGGVQPHKAPDGREGYEYSVEELCRMIEANEASDEADKASGVADKSSRKSDGRGNYSQYKGWDYHLTEGELSTSEVNNRLKWQGYIKQACEAISIRDPKKMRGLLPAFAQRFLLELKKPQVDWRQLLVEFIQDDVNDYSFAPPDKRRDDSPFYLPDFNARDEKVGKVLFAVDTSGSMSDNEITTCYSEIVGAVNQFDGKLEGWLCFFDAKLTEPVAFSDVDDLLAIKPIGGGGTSFDVLFDYLEVADEENMPISIVILTDGCAPFPQEKKAKGIPVLWVIDNEDVEVPWGKVARIKCEEVS